VCRNSPVLFKVNSSNKAKQSTSAPTVEPEKLAPPAPHGYIARAVDFLTAPFGNSPLKGTKEDNNAVLSTEVLVESDIDPDSPILERYISGGGDIDAPMDPEVTVNAEVPVNTPNLTPNPTLHPTPLTPYPTPLPLSS
jgi:hypothetical protein